jgi:hypothetical protein
MEAALYFSEMDVDGGRSKGANRAGAVYRFFFLFYFFYFFNSFSVQLINFL